MLKAITGEVRAEPLNDNFSAIDSKVERHTMEWEQNKTVLNQTARSVENVYNELSKNLFDGVYVDGVLFSTPIDGNYHLVPVHNFSSYQGKIAIIPIEHGKTYTIKVHDPEKQTMLRFGTSTEYPKFVDKGDDLQVGEPIPDGYYPLDGYRYVHNSNNINERTIVNDRNMNWLSIYVNNRGEEPRLQVEENSVATNYVPRINIQKETAPNLEINDDVAKSAFIEEMNRYAARIGMNNSHFVEPAGFPSTIEHKMSTKDMILLGIAASGYKEMARAWNKRTHSFDIKGPNPRSRSINSTVKIDRLEDYFVFGGKTGGITTIQELRGNHLLVLANAPNDNIFVGSIRQAETDTQRYEDMKLALDNAATLLDNPNATVSDVLCDSAAVALLPKFNPFNYEQYDIPIIYGKNVDVGGHPASVTKVMSAIIMLDYINDLNEKIVIKESDIVGGSGNFLNDGDIITFKDALYCMMLPSSNSATHAVARVVGSKILSQK